MVSPAALEKGDLNLERVAVKAHGLQLLALAFSTLGARLLPLELLCVALTLL